MDGCVIKFKLLFLQVRIFLLVLSVIGWTVFAMGMVDVISDLHK